MKVFVIGLVAVIVAAVFFVTGLFNSSTLSTLLGFCAWTPAVFIVGFGAASAFRGKRLALVNSLEPKSASSNPAPQPRQRIRPLVTEDKVV